MNDPSSKIMTDALANKIVQETKLHLNLSQDAIIITEDKVKLCLLEYLHRLEAKKDWIAPAGVLLTLVTTFVTTTFRDAGLPAPTWQAIFVIAAVLSGAWLVKTVWVALRAPSIEDVVGSMKRAGAQAAGSGPSSAPPPPKPLQPSSDAAGSS